MPATTASQAASAVHAPADMSVRSRNQSTHRCIPRSTHCRRCGGQQSTTEPTGTRTGAHPTNNVPGAPKKTDSKDAPTAPINIPPIFNKQGLDLDTVRASVESEIRDACGNGELCVAVAVSQGDNDTFTQCQYAESRDSTWPRSPNDNAFRNAVDVLAKYEQLLE